VELMGFFESVNEVLWGPVMLIMLLGTGALFTYKLRFIQFRRFKDSIRHTFSGMLDKSVVADESGISSFQALSTAIAAQVGTGNLVGVATAIGAGGPGAVFWMWVSGIFGMGTIFAESVLGQEYRRKVGGEMTGGPAYYIRNGLGSKALAALFAVAIVLALGLVGNMVQSNSIADAVNEAFHIPPLYVGLALALLAGLVIIGGITRIASVTERLVPIMALFYMIAAIAVIIINIDQLIPSLRLIVHSAFNPRAATGGVIGVTLRQTFRYGLARGLFSNEAGMGSTPQAHAVAKVGHPAQQGLVGIFGVIFDTFIVCTLTALVIITTGAWELAGSLEGVALTQQGFVESFGNLGENFIAVALFFFAFTTIISWYYFGESNIKYLFGTRALGIYKLLVVICVVIGSTLEVPVIWEMADAFNAIMVLPNLIALVGLASLVVKIYDDYEDNFLEGEKSQYENTDI